MPIYFCPLLNQPIITLFKVHCGLFWPERCSPKSHFYSIRRINMCKENMTFILRVTNWLLALNDITHSPFEIQSKAWNYYFLRRPDSVPRLFISTGSLWLLHREEVAARKFAHLLPKAKKNRTITQIKQLKITQLSGWTHRARCSIHDEQSARGETSGRLPAIEHFWGAALLVKRCAYC